jgi:hypothetical protein
MHLSGGGFQEPVNHLKKTLNGMNLTQCMMNLRTFGFSFGNTDLRYATLNSILNQMEPLS